MTRSAARLPDRAALSKVAGNPVAVQSPASVRLLHCVCAPGRLAFSSGVAAKVARLVHHFPEQHFGPDAFPAAGDVHPDERLTPAPVDTTDRHGTTHLSELTGGPHHDGRQTVLA